MSGTRIVRPSPGSGSGPFDAAADLHIGSIHHGLLPELGHAFLSRLYRDIAATRSSGVWVAMTEDDRVVGFLAGSADPKRCYRSVLMRSALPLTLRAGRSLLGRSVLGRLPTILSYPFRSTDRDTEDSDLTAAELLAIAVGPEARGQGVGARLVAAFEDGLREWGVEGRYRVATNVEEEVSNRFYRRLGFEPAWQTAHNDLTLQVYAKDLGGER